MARDYTPPVQDAIAAAHQINGSLGSAVDTLISGLWGDEGRVRQVADRWEDGADNARNSIEALRQEMGQVTQENWSGPAKDTYAQWIDHLMEQTLTPIEASLRETGNQLKGTAETIDDMRSELTRLCGTFLGAIGGLLGIRRLTPAAAIVAGGFFLENLGTFKRDYIDALDPHVTNMSRIRDKEIGVEVTTQLDQEVPVPVTEQKTVPPFEKSEFDWDNWESENPKVRDN